jgi:hypothetical protein
MRTLLQAPMRILPQTPTWTTRKVQKPVFVPEHTTHLASSTPAVQPVVSPETDEERRARALAAVSDDPAIQGFYDRCVPQSITPSAWMLFWPSAWTGLRD